MMDAVFLGLGSNVGDRLGHLRDAIAGLEAGGCKVLAVSSAYETPPWGFLDQPAFLNAVIQVQCPLAPHDLLRLAMEVEESLGRERSMQWGPRTIDIDVLAIGALQSVSQRLVIPHPLLHARAFVLLPWAEIAPDFQVPGHDRTVLDLLNACPMQERADISLVAIL